MSQDRFEAMVAQNIPCRFAGPKLIRKITAILLRREHAALVRAVKRLIEEKKAEIMAIDDGLCDRDLDRASEVHQIKREIQAQQDVLALLATRKGKK